MKSVIGQLGATLKDDHGVVMVVVVMFSVVVVISGLAFLSLSSSGSTMLERPLNRSKALYLAEGGMRKAIWRMNRSSLDQYALSATFSDTTADGLTTVAFDTTTNILTCTGVVDGINKTLPIEVEIEYTYHNHFGFANMFSQNRNRRGFGEVPEIDGEMTVFLSD